MTPDELAAELEAGRVRPAYLVLGEEPLLRDDALAALRAAFGTGDAAVFDSDRLDGADASAGALLDAVRTLPVLAKRRLVVLREPEAGRGRGLADAVAEAVTGLRAAGDATTTVLVVTAARADRRARFVRAFDPEALVRCDPPRPGREVAAFARAEAARQGVRLERGAAEELAQRTGPSLLLLRQEIAKAALLAGPGAAIAPEHVIAGTSDGSEAPIWDLTDATSQGETASALQALAKQLRAGAPPPLLLGALASHYRRLARVRGGAGVQAPPFVRRKLEGQARRHSQDRLLSCLAAIHETDLVLKGGGGGLRSDLALERLVIALAG